MRPEDAGLEPGRVWHKARAWKRQGVWYCRRYPGLGAKVGFGLTPEVAWVDLQNKMGTINADPRGTR